MTSISNKKFTALSYPKVGFLFVAFLAFVVALFNSPLTVKPLEEPETFRYLGMLLRKGYTPYVDGFDHKSPFLYFICAFAGTGGIWGLWLFSLGFTILVCYYLLLVIKKYNINYGILIPLAFIFLAKFQYNILGRSCETRDITAHLLVLLAALIFLQPHKQFFVKGVLVTLVPFTQQTDMLMTSCLIFAYLFYLLKYQKQLFAKALLRIALAAVLVTLLFIVYFLYKGALASAWYYIFTFNTSVFIAKDKTTAEHYYSMYYLLGSSGFLFPYGLVILFAIWSIIKVKYKLLYFLTISCIAYNIMAVVCVGFSGNYWHYYIHNLVSPFIFLFALALYNFSQKKIIIKPLFYIPALAAVFISMVAKRAVFFQAQKTILTHKVPEYKYKYPTWDTLINDVKGKDNELMIFNNPQTLCVASDNNMKLASKWVLTHFWSTYYDYANFDPTDSIFKTEYLAPIEKYKTTYLVKYTRPSEEYLWDIPFIRPSTLTIYDNYVAQHYTLKAKDSVAGWELFRRK